MKVSKELEELMGGEDFTARKLIVLMGRVLVPLSGDKLLWGPLREGIAKELYEKAENKEIFTLTEARKSASAPIALTIGLKYLAYANIAYQVVEPFFN